jgi:uncharacterized membrane protein
MDQKWLKNFFAFATLVGIIVGAVAYLRNDDAPARASTTQPGQEELDRRLAMERTAIQAFVIAKTSAAESKLDSISASIQDFKMETREALKKLDDRLYEMQRKRSAASVRFDAEGEGG